MMQTAEGATMDVVNDASSYVIEKALDEDAAGLQSFTIKSMDHNLPTGKNIQRYIL